MRKNMIQLDCSLEQLTKTYVDNYLKLHLMAHKLRQRLKQSELDLYIYKNY